MPAAPKLKAQQEPYIKKTSNFHYPSRLDSVVEVVTEGIGQGVYPGATLLIARDDKVLFSEAFGGFFPEGHIQNNPEVSNETVYDLGNLSSLIGPLAVLIKLLEQGCIKLEDQVIRFQQSFSVNGKASVTIGDLIYHLSGMAPSQSYHEELIKEAIGNSLGIMTSPGAKEYVYNRINRARLRHTPHQHQVYSDLGMILLGHIIEEITGIHLEKAVARQVLDPLEMNSTGYTNLNTLRYGLSVSKEQVAPTAMCPWRKKQIWGEVLDDNAWAMGGVSGHAGIFSNQSDLHKFANEMLKVYHGKSAWAHQGTLVDFWDLNHESTGLRYVGGWERPHKDNFMNESGLSQNALGFNSSTGCMIWLEPEENIQIIFLSNANCLSKNNKRIVTFYPLLVETILASI